MSAAPKPRVRIGAVPYLNARPLVFGLEQGLGKERTELGYEVPSVLAARLATGQLDLALLPAVELARIPNLVVVPGISISSRGPAGSVLLVTRKALEDVQSVALDPESRTSNALARVLFAEGWGGHPNFAEAPPDLGECLLNFDAAVRIGDKALFETLPPGVHAYDLGEAWTNRTGLPFVFAVWACPMGVLDRELYEILHASKRKGTRALESIARAHAWNGASHPEKALEYLTRNIFYRFGAAELQSLRRFHEAARRAGVTEREPEIRLPVFGEPVCETTHLVTRGGGEA